MARNLNKSRYSVNVSKLTVQKNPVFKRLNKDCPNWLYGCNIHLKKESLEAHLAECPFKEFVCPTNTILNGCSWKGNVREVEEHFDLCHREFRLTQVNKENNLYVQVNYRIMQLITKNSCNFLLYINVLQSSNQIQISVQMLGTKESASKWTFKFRIYGKNEDSRRFVDYIDTCYSITDKLDYQCLQNKATIISLDYAKTFANKDVVPYILYLNRENVGDKKKLLLNKSLSGTSRPQSHA
ncbi:uncharacterized protein LOC119832668 [Zerene cesonia]|uniref:uncharacterized protein LOC119832668 n=1 Tax=Zerene cesonia TaxID=33412 RepID=UPI0018E575BB|nr:uncharacterized protein LOC119832668 [Zerene cesonia]XP_038212315.1 uncharacterized protein LOC119832668 [Zerene cesonia]XP_038212323.1 uncharacterized protein LOC119832668 [Zerene cesonia]